MHSTSGLQGTEITGKAEWTGKKFFLIDTGGFVPDSEEKFEKAIRTQVRQAIEEANEILFVVDLKNGIHPADKRDS